MGPADERANKVMDELKEALESSDSSDCSAAVAKWQRAVSDGNWLKGEAVSAFVSAEGSLEDFVRIVGGVTVSHAQKLRLTWIRYAESRHQFKRLRWPHFFAALDWDDGELWLKNADVQGWTPTDMRQKRFECLQV